MAQVLPVSIAQTNSIESLRQRIVVALNSLSLRIAQTDQRTAPMDMGVNRITSVADPVNALDAVNLRTLKKNLQGSHQQKNSQASPPPFTIVMAISGTATGLSPGYVFNPNRTGSPLMAKIYALGTGTSVTGANIFYRPGGTGSPSAILANDIYLPGGPSGPVSETNFTFTLNFSVNDVVYTQITTAGGASNLTVELLVQP
jgi:hypothetical protein